MKLLDRYIIKQLALHFLLITAALASLYLLVDLFERLDNFQVRGLPTSLAARYFLLKLPVILDQVGPVSLLLAGIITLGLLINRHELQSLNAAGISTVRVLRPFAIGAMGCTILGLVMAQWLLPVAGLEANRIWQQQVIGERGAGKVRAGVTFFRGQKGIYTFQAPDRGAHEVLKAFRYQEVGEGASGGMTLFAGTATYRDGLWHLKDGQIRSGRPEAQVEFFTDKTLALPEKAARFFTPVALDFEQPIATMAQQALAAAPSGHRRAVLDLNRRLSFLLMGVPLLCLALPILLCFELGRTGINLAFAIPVSAGLAFLVWGLWSGLQAMAESSVVPVLMASWSIHGLCLAAGGVILAWRR
jgi:lipopolysaccharide export system permease protein